MSAQRMHRSCADRKEYPLSIRDRASLHGTIYLFILDGAVPEGDLELLVLLSLSLEFY